MVFWLKTVCRKDAVLSVSFVLAVLSCFVTRPSPAYIDYIDFRTLALLWCLMLVIAGLRRQRLFHVVSRGLLGRVRTERGIVLTLVLLCFVGGMLMTNDVALLCFVPLALMLLPQCGLERRLSFSIAMMTIAANLGSMLTPVGNPQNLFLFARSGMGLGAFVRLMLPFSLLSAALLLCAVWQRCGGRRLALSMQEAEALQGPRAALFFLLFCCCLLTIGGILPLWLLLLLVSAAVIGLERSLLRRADYALLLTFVFFFIFIGNVRSIQLLQSALRSVLDRREWLIALLGSQVISNVPAAVLLSAYTDNIPALLIGTNLGGLGTLIASMASLISWKQLTLAYPQLRGVYFVEFTLYNVAFLLCLLAGAGLGGWL